MWTKWVLSEDAAMPREDTQPLRSRRPLSGGRGERATFTGFYSDLPPHRRLPIAPLTSQLKYALPWGL